MNNQEIKDQKEREYYYEALEGNTIHQIARRVELKRQLIELTEGEIDVLLAEYKRILKI